VIEVRDNDVRPNKYWALLDIIGIDVVYLEPVKEECLVHNTWVLDFPHEVLEKDV
jgi:hypothetical protein